MIELDVKTDIAKGLAQYAALDSRQFPFIVSLAINRTMRRIKADERQVMGSVFDRPTPFTLNSLQTVAARKDNLEAVIKLRDFAGKGTPASKYLAAQIGGGSRPHKPHEKALAAAGILPPGLYAVPAQGAPLNAYGNLNGAYVSRILSYLKANRDGTQNRTKGSMVRNSRQKQFFAISQPDKRGLPLGIYERRSGGIRMVIAFVKAPTYAKRLPFIDVAQRDARLYLAEELRIAAEQAMATSRDASFTLRDLANADAALRRELLAF